MKRSLVITLGCSSLLVGALALLSTSTARAEELPECRSTNPADWPRPAKPYFMIAFDTSLSMDATDVGTNSCGYANTRNGQARCALKNMINAFAGEVNFGLAAFPGRVSGTGPATCPTGGTTTLPPGGGCTLQPLHAGDTNEFLCGSTDVGADADGANILVELATDSHWLGASSSNIDLLLPWVDNACDDCRELWTAGGTPLNGLLRDVERYLKTGWTNALIPQISYTTPLETGEFERYGTDGVNACRSVNVILLTDGAESCDPLGLRVIDDPPPSDPAAVQATAAAASMLAGWSIGGDPFEIQWKALTHVIAFGTNAVAGVNNIAVAGGTGAAKTADNEAELSAALATIIQGAIDAEVCDNQDNNCNGCTDEGFRVWCNRDKTALDVGELPANPGSEYCCSGPTREDCLSAYGLSIDPLNNKPKGDLGYLPCWDPETSSEEPETQWVCTDPGEICDETDNNCETTPIEADLDDNDADENFLKCPVCPTDEACNGVDDDCDGYIDNAVQGSKLPLLDGCAQCIAKAEICNGCDDNCDGLIDNIDQQVACGRPSPLHCKGTQECVQPVGSVEPGSCNGGAQFTECSNDVQTEICNGQDDNCNGIVDDIPGPPAACSTNGQPLDEGECEPGTLLCQAGQLKCLNYKGPKQEICDGLDNDCDGLTDDEDPDLAGVGLACGTDVGACDKGTTICSNGQIVCNQPNAGGPEVCNGIDDDCDGSTDEEPLANPPPDKDCWALQQTSPPAEPNPLCGQSCDLGVYGEWCAPVGAGCQDIGILTGTPCKLGTLVCQGGGWACVGGQPPTTEQCDGVDNDCDNDIDSEDTDILPAPIGDPCGQDGPAPCTEGKIVCQDGLPVCDGGVSPQPEVCDLIDNDCDGTLNNGLPLGDACTMEYDDQDYPGDRTHGICQPGNLECQEDGGIECVGGVAPSPEVCDGIDNDCDGAIDEPGAPPDGITGSEDPEDDDHVIGEECGGSGASGTCKAGKWGCVDGAVACVGGIQAMPEVCDCIDNDCDGEIDEDANDDTPICGGGKTCVEADGFCQCAAECGSGEFPCPGGFTCEGDLERSGTDEPAPPVCVLASPCGAEGCAGKTVLDSNDLVECAPLGSQPASSRPIPECACVGLNGCHSPCFGKECADGERCVAIEPFEGECRPNNQCMLFGCPSGQLCTRNGCENNPCADSDCATDEVCKPTADRSSFDCLPSCADIDCGAGEICVDGECQATGCSADCPAGQFCLGDDDDKACGESECPHVTSSGAYCDDGSFCDVQTGACGVDDPCAGVLCPEGQYCAFGQCTKPETSSGPGPGTGDGGEGGEGAGPTPTGGSAGTGTSGAGVYKDKGVFGLATGGGGCGCRTVGTQRSATGAFAMALMLGLAFQRRRRQRATPVAARMEGGAL